MRRGDRRVEHQGAAGTIGDLAQRRDVRCLEARIAWYLRDDAREPVGVCGGDAGDLRKVERVGHGGVLDIDDTLFQQAHGVEEDPAELDPPAPAVSPLDLGQGRDGRRDSVHAAVVQ